MHKAHKFHSTKQGAVSLRWFESSSRPAQAETTPLLVAAPAPVHTAPSNPRQKNTFVSTGGAFGSHMMSLPLRWFESSDPVEAPAEPENHVAIQVESATQPPPTSMDPLRRREKNTFVHLGGAFGSAFMSMPMRWFTSEDDAAPQVQAVHATESWAEMTPPTAPTPVEKNTFVHIGGAFGNRNIMSLPLRWS
ncbi:Aste57867_7303 [Aphanomyces stellatus]|uniref:Aste57867_7303 protein n=1 Tax=Aphanomyces stellatus TaxID=120398 RepID=A0A485KI47_9STRA|nr:hypothetical protein As57867_007277 [Aphanomyces stellatus]VFT84222.1 Aste57867_7303 [Aphanomyces stellatus]